MFDPYNCHFDNINFETEIYDQQIDLYNTKKLVNLDNRLEAAELIIFDRYMPRHYKELISDRTRQSI